MKREKKNFTFKLAPAQLGPVYQSKKENDWKGTHSKGKENVITSGPDTRIIFCGK